MMNKESFFVFFFLRWCASGSDFLLAAAFPPQVGAEDANRLEIVLICWTGFY